MSGTLSGDSIIISVDFGTTYSGSAATYRGDPDSLRHIRSIKNWSIGGGFDKVPTKIRYHVQDGPPPQAGAKRLVSGEHVTRPAEQAVIGLIDWGFEASGTTDCIQFLKLLLEPYRKLPPPFSRKELKAQLKAAGKEAPDAVTDYLAKLKERILKVVGRSLFPGMLESTRIEWILTVPAVWSDAARNTTLRAAERAGIGRSRARPDDTVSLVTEPEAAAQYALHRMKDVSLAVGDHIIVCDAGGGTVDLISYEIRSIDPFRLKESVPGTGDICGSALLDVRFQEHVKTRMGADDFYEFCQENADSWYNCMEHFEKYTKRSFSKERKEYRVPLFGAVKDSYPGFIKNHVVLTAAELEAIFDPVINDILRLVRDQFTSIEQREEHPRGIILVGGFGGNEYLYQALKDAFANEYSENPCAVIQPAGAWTAVSRGAVIHALMNDTLVQSRIARHHFGVLARHPFDSSIHSASNRVWDPIDRT